MHFPEMSREESTCLLLLVMPRTFDCGFFLYWPLFFSSFLREDIAAPGVLFPNRPSDALLNAMYLWGCVFGDRSIQVQSRFFARATSRLYADTPDGASADMLDVIQTQVLLANYLLRTGRVTETAALTTYARLHLLGSPQEHPSFLARLNHDLTEYSHLGSVDTSEKVCCFWTVLMLQRAFAILVQSPSTCGDLDTGDDGVTTEWPGEPVRLSMGPGSVTNTVRQYLYGSVEINARSRPNLSSILTRAFFLFDRSVQVYMQWVTAGSYGQPNHSADSGAVSIEVLDYLLESLRAGSPSVDSVDQGGADFRLVFYIHTFLDAATINLHRPFCASVTNSREKCVKAARHLFRPGCEAMVDMHAVHPLASYAWASGCHVLALAMDRLQRSVDGGWGTGNPVLDLQNQTALKDSFHCGLEIMEAYAKLSPVVAQQLNALQMGLQGVK
ncbi:hypothetical protein C8J57DRAFT_1372278 [Mycena rebaudengoi]|nr:hypothetical protein C8J57DRAFT_1372278 [Mycena rebaudengoi]